jgi:hypothetical protein
MHDFAYQYLLYPLAQSIVRSMTSWKHCATMVYL